MLFWRPFKKRRFKSWNHLDSFRERLFKIYRKMYMAKPYVGQRPSDHVKIVWDVERTETEFLPKKDKDWNFITHFIKKY